MYFTMGHMAGLPLPHWYHGRENALVAALLQFFLTLPPVYLNRVYYSRGLKALWNKAPNMDSLIAVGSIASLVYGVAALFRMAWGMGHGNWEVVQHYRENLYFESAAMILALITVGKLLEARAKLEDNARTPKAREVRARISEAVGAIDKAFLKQVDALDAYRFIDLESEMDVLADMLRSDGLTEDAAEKQHAEDTPAAGAQDDPFAGLFAQGDQ